MGAVDIALIVINCSDVASLNQGEALRKMRDWADGPIVEGHRSFASNDVRMWYLPEGVLSQNYLDRRWFKATGESVREAIFP